MRKLIAIALLLLAGELASADIRASVGFDIPGSRIGIAISRYPDLVLVPGYPVYYAPYERQNLFFYDGLYWVLVDDDWYVSSWYDGPWDYVDRYDVPLFLLRVPVRYYLLPPPYFRGWYPDDIPRWHEHWGREWERRRGHEWMHWDRRYVPAPAPLPRYQRDYRGRDYPRDAEHQRAIHDTRYHYSPQDDAGRRHDEHRRESPSTDDEHARQHDAPLPLPLPSPLPRHGDSNPTRERWHTEPTDADRRDAAPRETDRRDADRRDADRRDGQRNESQQRDRGRWNRQGDAGQSAPRPNRDGAPRQVPAPAPTPSPATPSPAAPERTRDRGDTHNGERGPPPSGLPQRHHRQEQP